MTFLGLWLLTSCALTSVLHTTAAESGGASTDRAHVTADPDRLPGLDSTSRLKSISFPKKAENAYPNGVPTMSASCDDSCPEQTCFRGLTVDGGHLNFDPDGKCDAQQMEQVETAFLDAITLAFHSMYFPNVGTADHGLISGRIWMGPDFIKFSSRISGNLKRVYEFKTSKTSTREYITISCNDPEKMCGKSSQRKAVGGYAKTVSDWSGHYHFISLCQPFFSLDSLDTKLKQIQKDLQSGVAKQAEDMSWLQTTGQVFLHEMMHLSIANGADEPHITDEWYECNPGSKPKAGKKQAYGPLHVYRLAQLAPDAGGGAGRASTNADSYAMLANAIYWWEKTTIFPGLPGEVFLTMADDALNLTLGNTTNVTLKMPGLFSEYQAELATHLSDTDEMAAADSPRLPASDQIYRQKCDLPKSGSNGSELEAQSERVGFRGFVFCALARVLWLQPVLNAFFTDLEMC